MVNRAKIPYLVASILSLSLFAYFLYMAYNNYKKFQILQNSYNIISSVYNSDNLIKSLDKEMIISARYLGRSGDVDFDRLKNARGSSDLKINFLAAANPDLKKELHYIREKVDVLSDNSKNEILDRYLELKQTPYNLLNENINKLSFIDEVKDRLARFKELTNLKNDLISSDAYISYILSKKGSANALELETLDLYLSKLSNFFSDIKDQIINKAVIGKSKLSYTEYRKRVDSKVDSLEREKKDIFLSTQREFNKFVVDPSNIVYSGILSILFLFLTILFFRKYRYIVDDEKKILKFKNSIKSDAKIGKETLKKIDKTEFVDVHLKDVKDEKSDDLDKEEERKDQLTLRGFDPQKKFGNVANVLLDELDKKDITFRYSIEKEIPTFAISSVSKIDEILNILVSHILKNCTDVDNYVEYDAQIVAQTKEQIAIMLRFYLKKESFQLDSLRLKRLVNFLEADYSETTGDDGDKEFFVTFNLSK